MVQGGYTGEGYTGVLPSHCASVTLTAKRAPEAQALGWSGWSGCSAHSGPRTHPPGPVGDPSPPWFWDLPTPRLWANKGEIKVNIQYY